MKTFLQYIIESKNTHLIHLEDLVFEGSDRVKEGVNFIEELVNMLAGNTKAKINTTVKYDGAPAIICGINPINKKFFVGTKSVFNKNPKVNYTVADIKKNHTSGVANKLIEALKYLKPLNIKGIIQGDMMFSSNDKKIQKIKGDSYITFTPNTITYAVPLNSELGKKIQNSKFGIIFHTKYTGRSLSSLSSSFNPNVDAFKNNKKVWVDDATFKDVSGIGSLTLKEVEKIYKHLENIRTNLRKSKGFINSIQGNQALFSYLNMYINSNIRGGSESFSSKEFLKWIDIRLQKELDSMKSEKGKTKKEEKKEKIIQKLNNEKNQMDSMFLLHSELKNIKTILIRKFEEIQSINTFIKTSDGFRVTKQEGFVGIDRLTNKAIKLVDRLEFSRANFNVPKNWIKG
jgi:hypothetical protein